MAHSRPPWGRSTTTSTRRQAGQAIRASAASVSSAAMVGSTMAEPRSMEITARLPARSKESRPASQPSTRGRLRVSRESKPLHTSNQRAVSRTDRDTQPTTTVRGGCSVAGPLRDAAEGRLEPEQPGEPGRDAEGAPAVTPAGDGEEATGHGRGRTARRSPGGPVEVPRVAGGPVELGVGAVDAAELGGGGLPGQDGPGRPEAERLGGVVVGDAVLEHQRGLGVGPSLDGLELLDAHGHAAEGEGDVGRGGRGPGRLGVHVAEGVEVGGVDGGQRGVECFRGADGPGAEGIHERAGVLEPGLIGHGCDPNGNRIRPRATVGGGPWA